MKDLIRFMVFWDLVNLLDLGLDIDIIEQYHMICWCGASAQSFILPNSG